jgi:hypothetical protein
VGNLHIEEDCLKINFRYVKSDGKHWFELLQHKVQWWTSLHIIHSSIIANILVLFCILT